MLINHFVNQISSSSDITPPWELPPIYWIGAFGLDVFLIALVWLWARSGRSKREKDTPYEKGAESFAGVVQAGYGTVPTFVFIVWLAVLIFIVTYTVLCIANGPQY